MIDSLLTEYGEKVNFWETYPAFLGPKIYRDFYESDKSKKKNKSSLVMWAINFLLDKSKFNPYAKLDAEDRESSINSEILNDPGFNWEMYADLIEHTRNILMTETEKSYHSFINKMEEKRRLIDTTPYTLDNAEKIDKIIINTAKIRSEIDEIKKLLDQEQGEGQTKGGILESAAERGWL